MWYLVIALVFCTLIGADAYLYSKGHNTAFFAHKTPEEKRLREAQIHILEKQAGIEHSQNEEKIKGAGDD